MRVVSVHPKKVQVPHFYERPSTEFLRGYKMCIRIDKCNKKFMISTFAGRNL